jgi:tripartite-type tricarboxylate transporter receptor subunit TctC
MTKIEMVHVPYKGTSQAIVGILTGESHLTFGAVAAGLPHIRQGRLRGIGVSGLTRSAVLPDVPTLAEAGVAGYDATSWYGLLAPSATPRPVIARLGEEAVKALAAPDSREKLTNQGIEPANGGPEEFAPYLAAEIDKWAKIIKAAGIPPQ